MREHVIILERRSVWLPSPGTRCPAAPTVLEKAASTYSNTPAASFSALRGLATDIGPLARSAKSVGALGCVLVAVSCGNPVEPVRVGLPVFVDASGITTVTTDLGYDVKLTEARVVVEDFQFAIAGELHTSSLLEVVSDLLLPVAYAHPGHNQEGDVTGEMRGRFVLDWLAGESTALGEAMLLPGQYKSANFTFVHATQEDGVEAGDELIGHTAVFHGSASKGSETIEFDATIDSPEGRGLIGAPFEFEVSEDTDASLGVRLVTIDPYEEDTLFDGLNFSALAALAGGFVELAGTASDPAIVDAYNQLTRTFQTHDHFDVTTSPHTGE